MLDNMKKYLYHPAASTLLGMVYKDSNEREQAELLGIIQLEKNKEDILTTLPHFTGNLLRDDLIDFVQTTNIVEKFIEKGYAINTMTMDNYGVDKLSIIFNACDERTKKRLMRKVSDKDAEWNNFEEFEKILKYPGGKVFMNEAIRMDMSGDYWLKASNHRKSVSPYIKRKQLQALDFIYKPLFMHLSRKLGENKLNDDLLSFIIESEGDHSWVMSTVVDTQGKANTLFDFIRKMNFKVSENSVDKRKENSIGRSLRYLISEFGVDSTRTSINIAMAAIRDSYTQTEFSAIQKRINETPDDNLLKLLIEMTDEKNILKIIQNPYANRVLQLAIQDSVKDDELIISFLKRTNSLLKDQVFDMYGTRFLQKVLECFEGNKRYINAFAFIFKSEFPKCPLDKNAGPFITLLANKMSKEDIVKMMLPSVERLFQNEADKLLSTESSAKFLQQIIDKFDLSDHKNTPEILNSLVSHYQLTSVKHDFAHHKYAKYVYELIGYNVAHGAGSWKELKRKTGSVTMAEIKSERAERKAEFEVSYEVYKKNMQAKFTERKEKRKEQGNNNTRKTTNINKKTYDEPRQKSHLKKPGSNKKSKGTNDSIDEKKKVAEKKAGEGTKNCKQKKKSQN